MRSQATVALRNRLQPSHTDERGAVLVEAALCLTLLLTVIAGMVNYGVLFGRTVDTASAVRSATMTGASTTTEPVPDTEILRTLVEAPGANRDAIQRVVIFRSNNGLNGPTPSCMAGNGGPQCNVYDAGNLDGSTGGDDWPAASRRPGVDFIGVWVRSSNTSLINFARSPDSYDDVFVVRISPTVTPPAFAAGAMIGWTTGTAYRPSNDPSHSCWGGGCSAPLPPAPFGGIGGST